MMRVPIARRNLFQSRTRLVMSVGGVALAALLVLALDGVFAGSADQVTVFMDNTPFDIVVSQEGVRNLHMTTSFFPEQRLRQIRRVDGVASADPIMFTTTFLIAGDSPRQRSLAYLIGYEPGGLGGPWAWSGERIVPSEDDIIIDERLAEDLEVQVGDEIKAVGHDFRVAGFDSGTTSIINSIAFVSLEGFKEAQRVPGVISFVLVTAESGVDRARLASLLAQRIDGVTVQTREEFSANERRIVSDMSIDIMRMMNVIAFIIGLVVTALTVYTATSVKVREYGVMKALGVRSSELYLIVAGQAAMILGMGLIVSVALAFTIQAALVMAGARIPMSVETGSLMRVGIAASVLGLLSAVIPVARISRLKPAEVFRR